MFICYYIEVVIAKSDSQEGIRLEKKLDGEMVMFLGSRKGLK